MPEAPPKDEFRPVEPWGASDAPPGVWWTRARKRTLALILALGLIPSVYSKILFYREYRDHGAAPPMPFSTSILCVSTVLCVAAAFVPEMGADPFAFVIAVPLTPVAVLAFPSAILLDLVMLPVDIHYHRRASSAVEYLAFALKQESIDEAEFARHWRDPYARACFPSMLRYPKRTDYPRNLEQIALPHSEDSRADPEIFRALSRNEHLTPEGARQLFISATRPRNRWHAQSFVLHNLAVNPGTPAQILA